MIAARFALVLCLTGLLILACSPQTISEPGFTPQIGLETPESAQRATAVISVTSSATKILSPTFTSTPSQTETTTPSVTPTPTGTSVPTYVKLRGMVVIDRAVCHYGPGAPYLYKYGVIKGSNLEIIRRVIGHNYIEVQAIGGDNPCWVREDYMQIRGDGSLENLETVHAFDVRLPMSPYYAPPGGITARRNGNEVQVSWQALILRAGDDSEQTPYIVEAWICRNGQMIFDPVRAWLNTAVVVDEPGCHEPSRARFIAAEKHGYTRPVEIAWPAVEEVLKVEDMPED
jgi:hypothetical protein